MGKLMEVVDFVDYSENAIKVEKLLAELKNLLLNRRFQEAVELCPLLSTEVRLLNNSIKIAHENDEQYKLVVQQPKNIPAMPTQVLPS
jgi:hypothetical protein